MAPERLLAVVPDEMLRESTCQREPCRRSASARLVCLREEVGLEDAMRLEPRLASAFAGRLPANACDSGDG